MKPVLKNFINPKHVPIKQIVSSLFLLSLCFFTVSVFAQIKTDKNKHFFNWYMGEIGEQKNISLYLWRSDTLVFGNYKDKENNVMVELIGEVDDEDFFRMSGVNIMTNKVYCYISGFLQNPSSGLKATWESPDKKSTMNMIFKTTETIPLQVQFHQKLFQFMANPNFTKPNYELYFSCFEPKWLLNDTLTGEFNEFVFSSYFGKQHTMNLEDDFFSLFQNKTQLFSLSMEDVGERNLKKIQWFLFREMSIPFADQSFISIGISERYDGDRFLTDAYTFKHFSIIDGKEFTLKDVLKPGAEKNMSSIIRKHMLTFFNLKNDDELQTVVFDQVEPSENFYLTKDDIVFVYNPYTLPMSEAMTVIIVIPLNEVKLFFKDDSPLAHLFSKK
jgi:hypothetical protein